ncbi:hypothetical protein ACIQVT_01725 [Streptomyces sp. NPDC100445]|uniref:hypothetical protein n=1 Tax=Streptomyces sp. NPDC100445 TaxID=3366102 RepID=UPI003827E58D
MDPLSHRRGDPHDEVTDAAADVTARWSTDGRVQGSARWTPGQTPRTGHTLVKAGLEAGSRVTVCRDDRGRLTRARPAGPAEGHVEAALFGSAAALAVVAPVPGAGAVARARIDRRRMARWDREWPRWGPTTG